MKNRYATLAIVLASLTAGSAMASTTLPGWGAVDAGTGTGLSSAQVKAETLQALRSGSIIATGELGTPVRSANTASAAMPMTGTDRAPARQAMAMPMGRGQMMAGGDATTRLY